MSGLLIPQPGRGLLRKPDERDERFRLRATPGFAELPAPRTHYWPLWSRQIDQGNTGTCVGHGVKHLLMAGPVAHRKPEPTPFQLYDWAIANDEWAENDRDTARLFGTSVRAGLQAARHYGLIGWFGWARTLDEALRWLAWRGPLVIGVDWTEGMMQPDRERIIRATGAVVGGHCVALLGLNTSRGLVYGINSWATFGRFWLPAEEFDGLMRRNGDVATPIETPPPGRIAA